MDHLPFPLPALMDVALNRHGKLETCAAPIRDLPPLANYQNITGQIYEDIYEDLGRFLHHGLEPGGLTFQIVQNADWATLRAHCHDAVSDDLLIDTVEHIQENLVIERDDNKVSVVPTKKLLRLTVDL